MELPLLFLRRTLILQVRRQAPRFFQQPAQFTGEYPSQGNQLHSQFQAAIPDQMPSSTSATSHADQVENMCVSESRRPLS